MKNTLSRHHLIRLSLFTLVIFLSACGAESYMSEEARNGHGASKGGGGIFSFLHGAGKATFGGVRNGIDMLNIQLRGELGSFTKEDFRIAKAEAETHPNLINGINGRNPMEGLCDNYLEMRPADRVNILMATAASVAYGEGHFGGGKNGGESNSYRRSHGRFQISHGAEHWGCWTNGYRPHNAQASIDCVYKMMDGQFQKNLPIVNEESYWSVLRAGTGSKQFLEEKFMSSFIKLAPQCEKRHKWVEVEAYPGPVIIGPQEALNIKDERLS